MKIKIVFHIMRMNWYRVLAAPIAEALRRDWIVECWHATYPEDAALQENKPSIDRVPTFKDGILSIREYEYESDDGLCQLVDETDAHVIVDIEASSIAKLCKEKFFPVTVFLDGLTHPILSRLLSGAVEVLPLYDIFAIPSKQHLSDIVKNMSQDHDKILRQMQEEHPGDIAYLSKWLNSGWTSQEEEYFIKNSFVVGTPSLDDISLINPREVKRRWGIPDNIPVVGFLPSPWDMPTRFFCGELNSCRIVFSTIWTVLKFGRYNSIVQAINAPKNHQIIKTVRKFCDYNKALMVTKLRHSRKVSKVLAKAADIVIGEDNYYPHSVLELFSVADVVFGFTTSGVYECVSAGTPYVDIELPFFPKKHYIDYIAPSLAGTREWPGVVSTISAQKAVEILPNMKVSDFQIDEQQRRAYLNFFTTYSDGASSVRFLDLIEHNIEDKVPHSV